MLCLGLGLYCGITFSPCPVLADDSFEGPKTSWQILGADMPYRLLGQRRVQNVAHSGRGSEWISVAGSGGTFIHIGHPLKPMRVIQELEASVWIRSKRSGLQLSARVVLPRTRHPKTGAPLTAVIAGTFYEHADQWQQLTVSDTVALVRRQTRVLRAQYDTEVDDREAYIDQLIVNTYGGSGVTDVWLDDLQIRGAALVDVTTLDQATDNSDLTNETAKSTPTMGMVQQQGAILNAGGKPFFPRIVRHQGEPLDYLVKLGFNAVRIPNPPTQEILAEAARASIRLVCPPPDVRSGQTISIDHAPVLAWDLGDNLDQRHLASTARLAEQIRLADRRTGRPIIAGPRLNSWQFSRQASILRYERPIIGTSFELSNYQSWLRERPRLARPGTPFWTVLPTQPSRELTAQMAQFARWQRVDFPGGGSETALSVDALRTLALSAIAAGSRGLEFQSHSRLDDDSPAARRRSAMLELLNLELDLIQPWASASTHTAEVDSTLPELQVSLLQRQRSWLVIATHAPQGGQFEAGRPKATSTIASLLVPGVPDSSIAYRLTPGGLVPLPSHRVAGGMRVSLQQLDATSLIVLTQDRLAIDAISRKLIAKGKRAAQLQIQLGREELLRAEQSASKTVPAATAQTATRLQLAQAKRLLARCDSLMATSDFQAAQRLAGQAAAAIAVARRGQWERVADSLLSNVASPYAVTTEAQGHHWDLAATLRTAQLGPNRLPAGSCENLQLMVAAGWQHHKHQQEGVTTHVELARQDAHSGRYSLRLEARPEDASGEQRLLESPPVQVVAAPAVIPPNTIARIQMWVRVPKAIRGSRDGVLIADSLGGDSLAERVQKTEGWQEVTLYRATGANSEKLEVSIALSGFGEVYVDDLSITTFEFRTARK